MIIKNIGIDGDGILTDLDLWQYAVGLEKLTGINLIDLVYNQEFSCLEELIEYFEKAYLRKNGIYVNLNEIIKNPEAYRLRDIFGISKTREYAIATFEFLKYCQKYRYRKEASSIMNKWHSEGKKLHIITARKFISQDSFVLLRNPIQKGFIHLMEKDNIPYDTTTWCTENCAPEEKKAACIKYSVDVMLDDKPDVVQSVKEVSEVICFAATYNKMCTGDSIYRVENDFIGADQTIQLLESSDNIQKQKVR